MQWSRLKSLVEARQAPSLRGRVTLHQARYRHAQEEVGRVWLAVDGREAAAFATHMGWARVRPLTDALMDERGAWGSPEAYAQASAEVEAGLRAAGEFSDAAALADLEAYLSLSAEDALAAVSPLVRALAVLDARVGKRRLRALAQAPDAHPLVRRMHEFRCEAEGIRLPEAAV
jgi:hypothetical protein